MDPMENSYLSNQPPRPASRGTGWKIFFGIILGLSIIANFVLFLALIVVGSQLLTGTNLSDSVVEKVIEDSSSNNKIAVIKIEGISILNLRTWHQARLRPLKRIKTSRR